MTTPKPQQFGDEEIPKAVAELLQRLTDSRFEEHATAHIEAWLTSRTSASLLLCPLRVSSELDMSWDNVLGLIESGSIPSVSVGGRPYVRRADLERWVDGLPLNGGGAK